MDVFHTGNYVRSHYNFLIQGLDDKETNFCPIVSTLYNIHFRGYLSKPSCFLKALLEKKGIKLSQDASVHLDLEYIPNWYKTIKGNDDGYNPALDFFEKKLPELLGNYSYLHSLFKPEALITDIIDNDEAKNFIEEQVDFFLPIGNIIIEIDGSHHESDKQTYKDRDRDKLFDKNRIRTFRLTTKQLNDEKQLEKFSSNIKRHLSNIKIVSHYKKSIDSQASNFNLVYSTIYRLQAIIIEMLGRNMLSLEDDKWVLWFESEIESNICKFAFDDLFNWVSLINKSQKKPRLIIDKEKSKYVIDISISRRWDDTSYNNNVVSCKTDHFDYFPDPVNGATRKDYFSPKYSSSKFTNSENLNFKGLLYEMFGYEDFNPGQIDIIDNVFQEKDTIGILPTGGGKSLCYQLPSILYPGLILVICPIKALMRDQVEELKKIGFYRSASIDSNTSRQDKERILKQVVNRQIRFLFVSPERLQINDFRQNIQYLYNKKLFSLLVIDEVHCVSEWGHDFRTSYLTLPHFLEKKITDTPKLYLTATASKKVFEDIKNEFKIHDDDVKTIKEYKRDNLHFSVEYCEESISKTHDIIKEKLENGEISNQKAGIIFKQSVNDSKAVAGAYSLYCSIKEYTDKVKLFTGSKPKSYKINDDDFEKEKSQTQKEFKNDKFSLLVATKAFGMGVNKNNVYTTIHSGLPGSVESLYQEAGRAGRDGAKSKCYVLFKAPSKDFFKKFFEYRDFDSFINLYTGKDSGGGDLSMHHYFLKMNIENNREAIPVIQKILNYFYKEKLNQIIVDSKDFNSKKDVTQLALYRLHQIGLISDWTVEDFYKGIYSVNYQIEEEIEYYEDIVNKLTGKEVSDNNYDDWCDDMFNMAKIVINHHLNTRVHSRIESLKTLLLVCNDYDSQSPEEFRKNIEAYFKIDSINDSLSDIVSSKGSLDSILSYLSGNNNKPLLKMPTDKIKLRLFALRRHIESYPDNISLKLINDIFMLHTEDSFPADNLEDTLKQYSKYKDLNDDNYYAFLEKIKEQFNVQKWNKLFLVILNNKNSKELSYLAKRFDSDIATNLFLQKVTPKLKKLENKIASLL